MLRRYSPRLVIVLVALALFGLVVASTQAQAPDPDTFIPRQVIDPPTPAPDYTPLTAKATRQGSLPVIVRLQAPFQAEGYLTEDQAKTQKASIALAQSQLLADLAKYTVSNVKQFQTIPFMALTIDAAGLTQLTTAKSVAYIEEDIPVPAHLSDSVPLIGAPTAWQKGYSGAGQAVAVLDTGVASSHPFLQNKVVSEACYSTTNTQYKSTTVCPNRQDQQVGPGAGVNCTTEIDGCHHGTHVAGIAAGRGNSFSGVARDASVIAVQVFSRFDNDDVCGSGESPCTLTFKSDQIRGLERVYELRTQYRIASANMSLGGGHLTTQTQCDQENQSTKAIIDTLRSVGIATVISSGNSGYTDGMGSPGCISSAISVGSTTKSDFVSSFSNSVSWLHLLAPGSAIYSSIANGSYDSYNGTSMAAPHVAGAWAIMKSRATDASVDQVYNAFRTTGVNVTDLRNNVIKPRINVGAAVDALAGGTPTNGIAGRITRLGQPVGGITLRLFVSTTGGQPTIIGSVTTDAQGAYQFTGAPSLAANQSYNVVFRNSDNNNDTRHLNIWIGPRITTYTAGSGANGGDFDIADVALGNPNTATASALPIAFNWTPRNVSGDQYRLEIFAQGGNPNWTSQESVAGGSYSLTTKPDPLSYNTPYLWDLLVVNGGGYGYSRLNNQVNLASGGSGGSTPTATSPSGAQCRTLASVDVPKAIPDSGVVTSSLSVGESFTLTDVNVMGLSITHPFDGDLVATLISPAGTRIVLFDSIGGGDDNFTNTTLDDQAATSIEDGSPPYTGRYRPSQPLNVLNGRDAAGTWRLEIKDQADQDVGTLTAWGVELCGAAAAPATPTRTATITGPTATRTPTATATRGTTPQPGGNRVYVAPVQANVSVGGATELEVRVDNITDLYGYELHLTFDPSKVSVETTLVPGSLFAGQSTQIFQTSVNNTTGQIDYAVSLQGVPVGVNGSGSLLRFTVRGLAAGASPIRLTNGTTLSNSNLDIISASLEHGAVTVATGGRLQGRIRLQGRSNYAGVRVRAANQETTTGADGSFELAGVNGTVDVEASLAGYLSSRRAGLTVGGGTTTLPEVTLPGGDATADNAIGIQDGQLVARWFGQAVPPADSRADINGDGRVTIVDGQMVSQNFGRRGPIDWPAGKAPTDDKTSWRAALPELLQIAGQRAGLKTTKSAIAPLSPPNVGGMGAQPSATLGFDPTSVIVAVNGTTTQAVKVTGAVDLYSFEVHLSFDPSQVQVVGTPEPGTLFAGRTTQVFINQVDNTTGRVTYAVSLQGASTGVTGDGTLLRLTWRGVTQANSTIAINPDTALSDSQLALLPVSVQTGSVIIGGGAAPTPTRQARPTETPPAGQAGIYGRVTALGTPVPQAVMVLISYDGENVTFVQSTETDAQGRYQFDNPPAVSFGSIYSAAYINLANDPRYLALVLGRLLFEYEEGWARHGGDIEIADVALGTPDSADEAVTLPTTFMWTPRLPGDSYFLNLFGPDDDPSWSPDEGVTTGEFSLAQLPDGFQPATVYGWNLYVARDDTFGLTTAQHQVKFASGSGGYRLFLPAIYRTK